MINKISITINTENAAFEDLEGEVSRILKDLSEKTSRLVDDYMIKDINDNTVGKLTVSFEE